MMDLSLWLVFLCPVAAVVVIFIIGALVGDSSKPAARRNKENAVRYTEKEAPYVPPQKQTARETYPSVDAVSAALDQFETGRAKAGAGDESAAWIWPMPEKGRLERAKKVQLISVWTNGGGPHARCKGSKGETYSVTLHDCTCRDFILNQKKADACKHMIALAIHCGVLNDGGLTLEQEGAQFFNHLAIKVALASGFYHVFKKPIISDAEYDTMKHELWDNSVLVDEEEIRSRSYEDADATYLMDMSLQEYLARIEKIKDFEPDEFAKWLQ